MGDDTGANAIRIGNTEREAAMKALDQHLEAGRLDPEEYGQRYAKASLARTEDELRPLFLDLPGPFSPAGSAWTGPGAGAGSAWIEPGAGDGWKPGGSAPAQRGPGRQRGMGPQPGPGASAEPAGAPLFGKAGERFVALSPFIALALFFVLGLPWVVFLIIPASGALVYGNMRGGRRNRSRCHAGRR